uniref:Capsid protein n=1 Tax=uncultured marine virus TaxID=186617 RepID=S4TF64_9VIRU|nr:hypothetical protein [uncultured marine virus]
MPKSTLKRSLSRSTSRGASKRKTRFSVAPKIPRSIVALPFPTEKTVTMKYCQVVSLDSGIGTVAYTLFRANSISDPYETGTGHQPYGHDQWSAVYNRYEVTSSKIVATFLPQTSGLPTSTTQCGISLKDNTTVETDIDTVCEASGTNYTFAIAQRDNYASNVFEQKKMFPHGEGDRLQAAFGGNPQQEAYFQLWARGVTDTTDAAAVSAFITIVYTVKMWELKDFGQS